MALEQILEHKRHAVAERQGRQPLDRWRSGLTRSDRSLEEALRRPRTGFILECKRGSPSEGTIRPDLDLGEVAGAYGTLADAISVLTDDVFFGGSFADLREIRSRVTVPVLCKDFILDDYQVYEARSHGADAILLMLSVLDDQTYRRCARVAHELALDILTEIHTAAELGRAVALDAKIIGINNRDLRTLQVDLNTTRRLAPAVPSNRIVVSESGIRTHADVVSLRPMVDAFLVGTSLMREPNLSLAARSLIFGRTKVCGLTTPEDAAIAAALGATHGGLIFAPESPRMVHPARVPEIQAGADLAWVGVFVNAPPDDIARLAVRSRFTAVQLHGEEDAAYFAELRTLAPSDCEIWESVRIENALPTRKRVGADRFLLDTYRASARGGTGSAWDWRLLDNYPERGEVVVSGGLTPVNVAAADRLGAYALDVNSGVESSPGKKDPTKLKTFLNVRRGTARDQEQAQ